MGLLHYLRALGTRKRNFALGLLALCGLIACARLVLFRPSRRLSPPLLLRPQPGASEAPRQKSPGSWNRLDHELEQHNRVAEPLSEQDLKAMPPRCSYHAEDEEPLNADDQGRICADSGLDVSSGCCVPSRSLAQYTCAHCVVPPEPKNERQTHEICCAVFADCISCCMASQIGTPLDGTVSHRFRRCVNRCRTSSRSLADDGHSYRYGANHHCFHTRAELHTIEHYEAESHRFHAELATHPYRK